MDLFQKLLCTVALSLLISFLLAKLLSMAFSDDVADEKSVSATEVMKKPVLIETEKYMGFDSDKRERFVDEVIDFNEFEEKGFRVESIRSSVSCNDTEIDDNGVVRVEESDCGEFGGDEFEENLFDESSERVTFCETDKESENIVEESPENVKFSEIEVESDNLVDESSENVKFGEIGIESENLVEEIPENVKFHGIDEVGVAKSEEIGVFESNKCSESDEVHKLKIELIETEVLQRKENKGSESDGVNKNAGGGDEGEGLFDDWEGIERTELDKQFGAAMVFVGSKSNADRISSIESNVKMQLYGLHKVAIEGHCCEPQPMALKVSARAQWNAWQRLGNMSREVAMEQYITLLSRSIPGWKGDDTTEGEKHFSDAGAERDFPSKLPNQLGAENEMKSEESKPCVEECDGAGVDGPNSTNRDKQ